MHQLGEAEFKKLSDRDRQKELMKLKLLEKQLRREGVWRLFC